MPNTTTNVTVTWGNGQNFLRRGTPLDGNGNVANNASAAGILNADLHAPDRTAVIVTAGSWDEDESNPYCGIYLSDACKTKLKNITFANPVKVYAEKSELPKNATAAKAGLVKKAANVAHAAGSAPTAEEFDGLVDALVAAGIMAAPTNET